MSPFALVSRGMAISRTVSSPRGSSSVGCDDAFMTIVPFEIPAARRAPRSPGDDDALNAGEVSTGRTLEKARLRGNCKHVAGLSRACFDDEPAVRRDQPRSCRKDHPIGVEAVDPAIERKARIEISDLGRKAFDLAGPNIGGVRDDEIERADDAVGPRAHMDIGPPGKAAGRR